MKILPTTLLVLGILPSYTSRIEQNFQFSGHRNTRVAIQNDYGEIDVTGAQGSEISVYIVSVVPQGRDANDLLLTVQEHDGGVHVSTLFTVLPAWAVDLRVEVPTTTSVTVSGLQPVVDLKDIRAAVRVQTTFGPIRIEDVSGPTTATTDSGIIQYVAAKQPEGDVHLNTESGPINCTLASASNLEALLRSESISWGSEAETSRGHLRRVLGVGGPLLYASSGAGRINVSLNESEVELPSFDSRGDLEAPSVIRVDVDWVYLNVSVRDSLRATSVFGLNRDDFLVYENGTPQSIAHFESTEAPFQLLLLLDMSESVRRHLSLIRSAAIEFTKQTRPGDQLAIAEFNQTFRLLQGFTESREPIVRAIKRLSTAGGTAVYDSLFTALTDLGGIEGRNAIVLFTDGVDNSLFSESPSGSKRSFEELLQKVNESDCLIYPIYLSPGPQERTQAAKSPQPNPASLVARLARVTDLYSRRLCTSESDPNVLVPCGPGLRDVFATAELHMRTLAEQTGGRLYRPVRIGDLAEVYAQIASELRTHYTLGYEMKPTNEGEWRNLKVRIRNRPQMVVRTRAGYYAPAKQP